MAEIIQDKKKLLKSIQICSFNAADAALYLDTHNDDKEAMEYYRKHCKELAMLKAEYAEKYGPLTMTDNCSMDKWEWASAPWPWEMQ